MELSAVDYLGDEFIQNKGIILNERNEISITNFLENDEKIHFFDWAFQKDVYFGLEIASLINKPKEELNSKEITDDCEWCWIGFVMKLPKKKKKQLIVQFEILSEPDCYGYDYSDGSNKQKFYAFEFSQENIDLVTTGISVGDKVIEPKDKFTAMLKGIQGEFRDYVDNCGKMLRTRSSLYQLVEKLNEDANNQQMKDLIVSTIGNINPNLQPKEGTLRTPVQSALPSILKKFCDNKKFDCVDTPTPPGNDMNEDKEKPAIVSRNLELEFAEQNRENVEVIDLTREDQEIQTLTNFKVKIRSDDPIFVQFDQTNLSQVERDKQKSSYKEIDDVLDQSFVSKFNDDFKIAETFVIRKLNVAGLKQSDISSRFEAGKWVTCLLNISKLQYPKVAELIVRKFDKYHLLVLAESFYQLPAFASRIPFVCFLDITNIEQHTFDKLKILKESYMHSITGYERNEKSSEMSKVLYDGFLTIVDEQGVKSEKGEFPLVILGGLHSKGVCYILSKMGYRVELKRTCDVYLYSSKVIHKDLALTFPELCQLALIHNTVEEIKKAMSLDQKLCATRRLIKEMISDGKIVVKKSKFQVSKALKNEISWILGLTKSKDTKFSSIVDNFISIGKSESDYFNIYIRIVKKFKLSSCTHLRKLFDSPEWLFMKVGKELLQKDELDKNLLKNCERLKLVVKNLRNSKTYLESASISKMLENSVLGKNLQENLKCEDFELIITLILQKCPYFYEQFYQRKIMKILKPGDKLFLNSFLKDYIKGDIKMTIGGEPFLFDFEDTTLGTTDESDYVSWCLEIIKAVGSENSKLLTFGKCFYLFLIGDVNKMLFAIKENLKKKRLHLPVFGININVPKNMLLEKPDYMKDTLNLLCEDSNLRLSNSTFIIKSNVKDFNILKSFATGFTNSLEGNVVHFDQKNTGDLPLYENIEKLLFIYKERDVDKRILSLEPYNNIDLSTTWIIDQPKVGNVFYQLSGQPYKKNQINESFGKKSILVSTPKHGLCLELFSGTSPVLFSSLELERSCIVIEKDRTLMKMVVERFVGRIKRKNRLITHQINSAENVFDNSLIVDVPLILSSKYNALRDLFQDKNFSFLKKIQSIGVKELSKMVNDKHSKKLGAARKAELDQQKTLLKSSKKKLKEVLSKESDSKDDSGEPSKKKSK